MLRLIVCSFALPKTKKTLSFSFGDFLHECLKFFFLGGLDLSFILGSLAIWSLRIFYFYEGGFNFVRLASFKNCNFFLSGVCWPCIPRQGYCV